MSRRPWKAMAAMAENRVIGSQGKLPWNLPEELQWVRTTTLGGVMIMGRKTYESIGRPMPKRTNVIVSRSLGPVAGCTVIPNLQAVDSLELPEEAPIWIFGGAEIYRAALPRVRDLYLTIVKRTVEGDTWFPPFEDRFRLATIVRDTPDFQIRLYVNDAWESGEIL